MEYTNEERRTKNGEEAVVALSVVSELLSTSYDDMFHSTYFKCR